MRYGPASLVRAGVGVIAVTAANVSPPGGIHGNSNLAEGSIQLGVGRRVAKVVLAAQLAGNLIKPLFELLELVSHLNDPSTGFLGELVGAVQVLDALRDHQERTQDGSQAQSVVP